jgi:hypothetical protein
VAVTNQTGTVTTSATTTSLTTDRFKGLVFAVTDDNGAEVAPEGEATNISSNTTTQITFDTETPLSAALASGDDGSVISWGKMVVAAASGDQAFNVAGVVATQTDRLTTSTQLAVGSYGWVGCHGLLDQVLVSADLSASGENAVIAGTGVCAPAAGTSTTQISTLIGAVPDLIGAGTALKCPVILNVLFNGAATRD